MSTIAELLFDRGAAADQLRRLLDKRATALGLLTYGLADATRQVADAVAGLLTMPVGNLIFHAWTKHQAIRHACAQTAGRAGGAASVVVAEHTLETTHRPRVNLDIAGRQVPILDLVVTLTLHIESVVVTVFEGRVTGCEPGAATSTAELGVARPGGDSHPLVRRELRRVSLQWEQGGPGNR